MAKAPTSSFREKMQEIMSDLLLVSSSRYEPRLFCKIKKSDLGNSNDGLVHKIRAFPLMRPIMQQEKEKEGE